MTHIFISDLHLSPHKPELSRLFQAFLAKYSGPAFSIYILGDLFDIWLGDDFSPQFYQDDINALKASHQQGSQLFLMHGNRDFLIGSDFANTAGLTLLRDPTAITLHGEPVVLTHGDQLCTDDVSYQELRATIQNKAWIADFLAKSVEERLQMADHVRKESYRQSKEKSTEIMDTNQQAIENFMMQHQTRQLIHGHTHRPNKHQFTLNGLSATRWVLGDWHADHAQILIATDETMTLTTFEENTPRP